MLSFDKMFNPNKLTFKQYKMGIFISIVKF